MIAESLLDRSRFEIKLGEYAVGPATALGDATALAAAQDYRRGASARMMPLGKEDIRGKIPAGDYHVSRKVDGEFTVMVFMDGEAFSINPGGTVRLGLPWLKEAAETLASAGIKSARIAGELFVNITDRRPRVHDVSTIARGPKSEDDLHKLRFAPFDVIEIDGQPPSEIFADTFQTLESLFGDCKFIQPVETRVVKDVSEIQHLFVDWVEREDAEGLVVRSDSAGTFKIKPRHTLDAIVVGFTESTEDRAGMLHDLLVAVMRPDGTFHVLTRVGGGFSDELRRSMLSDLKDMIVPSEYVEVNSDYVAYQMVRPDWVVEISCLDLISQTTRGGNVNRMVVEYDSDGGYQVVRRMPLATVISPQFVRRREDKQRHPEDVRISQVSDRVEVALIETDAKSFKLPTSQVLRRQVFTKVLKGATMVRKFVLLKTNKEQSSDEFPAYVLHFTDFSPNRKDALTREVLVSNSQEQIQELYDALKEENIKKGWNDAMV
jgi:hypothetical protein